MKYRPLTPQQVIQARGFLIANLKDNKGNETKGTRAGGGIQGQEDGGYQNISRAIDSVDWAASGSPLAPYLQIPKDKRELSDLLSWIRQTAYAICGQEGTIHPDIVDAFKEIYPEIELNNSLDKLVMALLTSFYNKLSLDDADDLSTPVHMSKLIQRIFNGATADNPEKLIGPIETKAEADEDFFSRLAWDIVEFNKLINDHDQPIEGLGPIDTLPSGLAYLYDRPATDRYPLTPAAEIEADTSRLTRVLVERSQNSQKPLTRASLKALNTLQSDLNLFITVRPLVYLSDFFETNIRLTYGKKPSIEHKQPLNWIEALSCLAKLSEENKAFGTEARGIIAARKKRLINTMRPHWKMLEALFPLLQELGILRKTYLTEITPEDFHLCVLDLQKLNDLATLMKNSEKDPKEFKNFIQGCHYYLAKERIPTSIAAISESADKLHPPLSAEKTSIITRASEILAKALPNDVGEYKKFSSEITSSISISTQALSETKSTEPEEEKEIKGPPPINLLEKLNLFLSDNEHKQILELQENLELLVNFFPLLQAMGFINDTNGEKITPKNFHEYVDSKKINELSNSFNMASDKKDWVVKFLVGCGYYLANNITPESITDIMSHFSDSHNLLNQYQCDMISGAYEFLRTGLPKKDWYDFHQLWQFKDTFQQTFQYLTTSKKNLSSAHESENLKQESIRLFGSDVSDPKTRTPESDGFKDLIRPNWLGEQIFLISNKTNKSLSVPNGGNGMIKDPNTCWAALMKFIEDLPKEFVEKAGKDAIVSWVLTAYKNGHDVLRQSLDVELARKNDRYSILPSSNVGQSNIIRFNQEKNCLEAVFTDNLNLIDMNNPSQFNNRFYNFNMGLSVTMEASPSGTGLSTEVTGLLSHKLPPIALSAITPNLTHLQWIPNPNSKEFDRQLHLYAFDCLGDSHGRCFSTSYSNFENDLRAIEYLQSRNIPKNDLNGMVNRFYNHYVGQEMSWSQQARFSNLLVAFIGSNPKNIEQLNKQKAFEDQKALKKIDEEKEKAKKASEIEAQLKVSRKNPEEEEENFSVAYRPDEAPSNEKKAEENVPLPLEIRVAESLEKLILKIQPEVLIRFQYFRNKLSPILSCNLGDKEKELIFFAQLINELSPRLSMGMIIILDRIFYDQPRSDLKGLAKAIFDAQRTVFQCYKKLKAFKEYDIHTLLDTYRQLEQPQVTIAQGLNLDSLKLHRRSKFMLLSGVLRHYGLKNSTINKVSQELKKGNLNEFIQVVDLLAVRHKLKEKELHCLYCQILPAVTPSRINLANKLDNIGTDNKHGPGASSSSKQAPDLREPVNKFIDSLLDDLKASGGDAARLTELRAVLKRNPDKTPSSMVSQRATTLAFFIKYGTLTNRNDYSIIGGLSRSGHEENSLRNVLMQRLGLEYSQKQLEGMSFNQIFNAVMFRLHLQPLLESFKNIPVMNFSGHANEIVEGNAQLIEACRKYENSGGKEEPARWLLKHVYKECLQKSSLDNDSKASTSHNQTTSTSTTTPNREWKKGVLETLVHQALSQCRKQHGNTRELQTLESTFRDKQSIHEFKESLAKIVEWKDNSTKQIFFPTTSRWGLFGCCNATDTSALRGFRSCVEILSMSYCANNKFKGSADFAERLDYILNMTAAPTQSSTNSI